MSNKKQELLKTLPAVDRLLSEPSVQGLSAKYPRNLILKAIRSVLEELRTLIKEESLVAESDLTPRSISTRVAKKLQDISQNSLRPLINATGVVVHTNLGRSILAERVIRKLKSLAGGYSNLEYDLDKGSRGSRYVHVEDILKELTGAESAMVVNNNAAAVLLCIETMAKGREVVISRGQLVEIGGSFRVPDVMRKSGATMVEIGTTNKTHLSDYEEVIGPETGLLLRVHTSNFQIMGFTEEVALSDLVGLGRKYGVPVMDDLGSGCLVDFSHYGLKKEPTVMEALNQGADLVTFSGDKLLGGPQAGIILGRKNLVESIKSNQLTRALRIDKLTLIALEETLRLYRDEKAALKEVPTLNMIFQPYSNVKRKAERLAKLIGKLKTKNFTFELTDGNSTPGGGALPLLGLPSRLLSLSPNGMSPQFMERWFRHCDPPIITRLEKDKVLFDVRTIRGPELKEIARAVRELAVLDHTPKD